MDFDDLEEAEEGVQERLHGEHMPEDHLREEEHVQERQPDVGQEAVPTAAEGSRWHPRCGPPPAFEAPLAPSLIELDEGQLMKVPKCCYSLKPFMSAKKFKEVVDTQMPGAHYNMTFPHNFDLLREAGAPWLTEAFHAAGTLPADNRVVAMTLHELSTEARVSDDTGAQGLKAWLEVEYEWPHPELHTQLFVKLPFPSSATSERMKNSLTFLPDESEILISRLFGPLLPFKTPKYYFGEFSYESSNYILITERIAYKGTSWKAAGKDMVFEPMEIEPRILKFRDYEVPENALQHYRAVSRALGKMVAEYHKGGLGSIELLRWIFPREPPTPFEGMGWEAAKGMFAQNGGKLTQEAGFVTALEQQNKQALSVQSAFAFVEVAFLRNAPQLFPKEVSDVRFLKQWYREAMEVVYYTAEITFYIHVDPAFLSLVHTNLTADNAWYWRNTGGDLDCGLLDFGATAHQNIAMNMLASWQAAEPDMLKKHSTDLLWAFVNGCQVNGGPPSITLDELQTCVFLALAMQNAGVGSSAMQLLRMMPKEEWAKAKNIWDPKIENDFVFRTYVRTITMMLSAWRDLKLFTVFKSWRRKNEHWMPKKQGFTCPPIPPELQ